MRKWTCLIAMCCSLLPAVAAAQQDVINQNVAAPLARQKVAAVKWDYTPSWDDADIWEQFKAIRDTPFLKATSSGPYFRRIPWLFPDEGCYYRAWQAVNVLIKSTNRLPLPNKLFVWGDFNVLTPDHPDGSVFFKDYHVAAVVRRKSNGEPVVLDPTVDRCRPLPWKDWLLRLSPQLSDYDQLGWGIVLADSTAYGSMSNIRGNSPPGDDALNSDREGYLNDEWARQAALGRDPTVVLGSTPPWSGYACVNTEERRASATLSAGATKTITATCPFGTLATGGTFAVPPGFLIMSNAKSGNGWALTVRNTSSASSQVDVRAVCLIGAPSNATVETKAGSIVKVSNKNSGSSSATCASGTKLVGGGYETSGSTATMRVYSNKRVDNTSSSWRVSAQNTTGSDRTIQAFAYCLKNTNLTTDQVVSGGASSGAFTFASCSPEKVLGHGYAFPPTSPYQTTYTSFWGSEGLISKISGTPASPDPNAVSYAECVGHP